MPNLGSFGKPADAAGAEVDSFDFHGEQIRVVAEFSELEYIDLMERVGGMDEDDPRSLGAVKDLFRLLILPEDLERFWSTAKANRYTSVERHLMPVFVGLMEALTDRPTRLLSDSSERQQPNGGNSPAVSSAAVSSGRPDLQVIREEAMNVAERLKQLA